MDIEFFDDFDADRSPQSSPSSEDEGKLLGLFLPADPRLKQRTLAQTTVFRGSAEYLPDGLGESARMKGRRLLSVGVYRAALMDLSRRQRRVRTGARLRAGLGGGSMKTAVCWTSAVHQEAVNGVLASTPAEGERLRQLEASGKFHMEALSTFELLSRGYLALLESRYEASQPSRRHGSSHH